MQIAIMQRDMKTHTVLFVDDEVKVLSSIRRALQEESYKCLFASSANEALKILEQETVHVVVTDMRMPGFDGLKFLLNMKENHPDIVKMVLSGYSQLPQVLATVNQVDIFKFLLKPWDNEKDLRPAIKQAIDYYDFQVGREVAQKTIEKRNELFKNMLSSMEDKLNHAKKDYSTVIKISSFIFDGLKKELNKRVLENRMKTDELNIYLDSIQEIYSGYLSLLPISKGNCKLNYLLDEIKKSDLVKKNSIGINYMGDSEQQCEIYTDIRLLIYVMMTLIKRIIGNSNGRLSLKIFQQNKGLIFCIMGINDTEKLNWNNNHGIFIALLNEMIENIGGNINYEETRGMITAQFQGSIA